MLPLTLFAAVSLGCGPFPSDEAFYGEVGAAIVHGDLAAIARIPRGDPRLDAPVGTMKSPLILAVEQNRPRALALLLARGAQVNAEREATFLWGARTNALCSARFLDRPALAKLLVAAGAHDSSEGCLQRIYLLKAAMRRDVTALAAYRRRGQLIHQDDLTRLIGREPVAPTTAFLDELMRHVPKRRTQALNQALFDRTWDAMAALEVR